MIRIKMTKTAMTKIKMMRTRMTKTRTIKTTKTRTIKTTKTRTIKMIKTKTTKTRTIKMTKTRMIKMTKTRMIKMTTKIRTIKLTLDLKDLLVGITKHGVHPAHGDPTQLAILTKFPDMLDRFLFLSHIHRKLLSILMMLTA